MNSKFMDAYSVIDHFSNKLDKPVENYAEYMTEQALDEFSVQLVNYRMEHQMNQTDLAKELGIRQPMISQYESGTNNITVKRLCEICEKLGLRVQINYEKSESALNDRPCLDPFFPDSGIKDEALCAS